MTSHSIYNGKLRTTNTHVASGATFQTDAPVDNNGKGEAFSPTDTVANALASCMLTIMGVRAEKNGISLKGSRATVVKTMASNPRRISKIEIAFTMEGDCPTDKRELMEKVAAACPVHKSLHPDIETVVTYNW